jgi:regulator of replication initiation timing
MKLILATTLILAPALALAQSPPPKTDVVQDIQQDFQTLAGVTSALPGAQSHLAKDLGEALQELTKLRAENDRLKSDLASKTAAPATPAPAPTPASR